LQAPRLQLPAGDQGSKGADVLAVSSTIPTTPRLAVTVRGSRLERDGVGATSIPLERGKNHLERCHKLKEVVADDFLTASGVGGNTDNAGSSGALVRGNAYSNPRPVTVEHSGRRDW
jgi:hypothetical protein